MKKDNKSMRCVRCGGTARPAKLSFQGFGIDGWKCACGEEYFDPAQAERILTLNKLKRQAVEAKLGRIKSNLILRIPKAVEHALKLQTGGLVKIRVLDNKTVEIAV
ncbi:MAG: hypothetical protein AB1468_03585 [Candidatus Micrarchaeota archaeon]